jgi:PAS domain S-box-containing protein
MNEAVMIKSVDGTIVLWNRAAAELFGYSVPEIIGEKADILIPPGEMRLRGGGTVRRVNAVRIAKDGVRIQVILTATVIDRRRPARSEIMEIYRAAQAAGVSVIPAAVSF